MAFSEASLWPETTTLRDSHAGNGDSIHLRSPTNTECYTSSSIKDMTGHKKVSELNI